MPSHTMTCMSHATTESTLTIVDQEKNPAERLHEAYRSLTEMTAFCWMDHLLSQIPTTVKKQ